VSAQRNLKQTPRVISLFSLFFPKHQQRKKEMELDPDDIFKDDEDDPDSEFYQVRSLLLVTFTYLFFPKNETLILLNYILQQRESSKEFVVYLVDASPKMFSSTCPSVSIFSLSLSLSPSCFFCIRVSLFLPQKSVFKFFLNFFLMILYPLYVNVKNNFF
jgi:hypothetical protein